MNSNRASIVTALLLFCLLGTAQAIHNGFAKTFGPVASSRNARTMQLLNQLCNESQDEDSMKRDACYGCFYRASVAPHGYPMLTAMSICAGKYLNNTAYGHCRTYLSDATMSVNVAGTPMVTYCTFLECIRQVNKDTLISLKHVDHRSKGVSVKERLDARKKRTALVTSKYLVNVRGICEIQPKNIQLCVAEALGMFSNFSSTDVNLAKLFVNTTACILAKTRCAVMNPITGATRLDDAYFSSKLHATSINALLVNTNYDINIVQLPYEHGVIDECAKYRNVHQAAWPTVQCTTYTSGL